MEYTLHANFMFKDVHVLLARIHTSAPRLHAMVADSVNKST